MNLINRFTVKSFLHLFLLGLLTAGTVGFNIYGKGQSVHADTPVSPWLAAEAPKLTNLKTNVGFDEIPQHIDGNQECLTKQSFVVRPSKPWQSEQSYVACGVDTVYGTVDRSALNLVRTGTHIAGPVYDQYGTKLKLYPIPNSDTTITYSSAPSGLYITLQRDVSKHLTTDVDSSGKVRHTLDLSTVASHLVKDELSKPVDARLDTAASSGNGKWMVFDYSYVGLVRLNMETGEVFVFAPGYKYNIGRDPALNLAISGDGRYVAESSYPYSAFRVYDLSTCSEASEPDKPASCQSRDLRQVLKSGNPDQIGTPNYISFTDDYTLKFYGTTLKDGVKERHVQLLSAYGHSPVEFSYLSLGDSFASGEGAFSYKAGTDVRSPLNKCHVSVNSYPYLIGSQLNLDDYESVACSGAKIKDINSQGIEDYNHNKKGRQSEGQENKDFDAKIFSNFLPGYRIQKEFVKNYHPDKITVSISGNDMGFGNIVRNCVFWNNDCYASDYERAVIVKTVNDRFGELVAMYNQLKESSPASTIYAIGYPKLVNPGGVCDTNVHASRDELRFFDGLEVYINSVIKKAADKAGVYYVDVSDALVGNRLCEANGHEPAVNGLTAGDDKLFDIGPIGNESYHPNALGHELLEKAILEKTGDFSAKNPAPKYVEAPK
ncbi:MAG TPA: SGNH/GDSL hydrolase family protein, partial [Candidatus Saccharimonadales bacterium]|nr:SGNH/GDSL hydrolase family protein [Candidatus Saccharimonadales bacterium]